MIRSQENVAKKKTDDLAGQLLSLDDRKMARLAEALAELIIGDEKNRDLRICVAGGAGSGKSTLAKELSKQLELPVFDLDQFIKGGWTKNQKEYDRRFANALYDCWSALPAKKGWIIEHVEAGNPYLITAFKPSYLIRLTPSERHLRRVAGARALAAGENSPVGRVQRALDSDRISKEQFNQAKGTLMGTLTGCTMKAL